VDEYHPVLSSGRECVAKNIFRELLGSGEGIHHVWPQVKVS
jgi:hypothetical protein